MSYKATIGLEIHAELKTKSKMFCGCKNEPHADQPNIHICPICLAHPGTLPQVNEEAVKSMMMIGTAVGGELADYSEFDRKNYFYPDIPKAYQLSQYAFPFVSGGEYDGVKLTRIHLEEDTARSQHSGQGSVVDFNRAGVPLMELVTEPVIHDAETATHFAQELQLLLRTLGASTANMELGEMRVEANISVSDTDELGTKVEVKNLNSFKSVEQAIAYEIDRQIDEITNDRAVKAETRGWDEQKGRTFSQRSKETAEDYRYFADPDIPKYQLSSTDFISRVSEIMPELPLETKDKYKNWDIRESQVEVLLYNPSLREFFEATADAWSAVDTDKLKLASNYLTSDVLSLIGERGDASLDTENAQYFAVLIDMVSDNEIGSRVAKDLLPEVIFEGKDPKNMAKERGLLQASSTDELMPIVEQIVADNPEVVAEYKAGKDAAVQYLVGQGMKATKGSANPAVLKELLQQVLA